MTRDEWDQVEQQLRRQVDPVYLNADGYLVRLMLQRVGEMKLGISAYVDGWFHGKELMRDHETGAWPEVGRRFYQLRERRMYSPKEVRRFERQCGKKAARKYGLYKTYQYRMPYWQSAKSLRRHFVRENSEIVWLSYEEYSARIEEKRQRGEVA